MQHTPYLEGVEGLETEDVAPEVLEGSLAGSTDGNLLDTEDSVGLSRSESTLLIITSHDSMLVQQSWQSFSFSIRKM